MREGRVTGDEEYIISEAKRARASDPHAAEAWMLTAKTLYPSDPAVQFEAYSMEKANGRAREAADCLAALLENAAGRPPPPRLRAEVDAVAAQLDRDDGGFSSRMFDLLPPETQHAILASAAERSEDTTEHCRLLLLLLRRFPKSSAAAAHGGPLVETLLSAERHGSDDRYSRLLVVEALPLLEPPQPPRLLLRLLVRAIDYYTRAADPADRERGLLDSLELTGAQLGWEPALVSRREGLDMSSEAYSRRLRALAAAADADRRQVLYCAAVRLLRALGELEARRAGHLLVEAFRDRPPPPQSSRRRRPSSAGRADAEVTGAPAAPFVVAADCWDLLHSDEGLAADFAELSGRLRVRPWTCPVWRREAALRADELDDAEPPATDVSPEAAVLRASVAHRRGARTACLEHALAAFARLPAAEGRLEPAVSLDADSPSTARRHLHFLPPTRAAVAHYCAKLALRSLESGGDLTDLAAGDMIVLLQLDWPKERPLLTRVLDAVRRRGAFRYPPFRSYVVNADVLEELTYLWSERGGGVALDVLPDAQRHLGQRRIGTRGADRGAKEDVRQAMRAQVARCNDSVLDLVVQFATRERANILQNLLRFE